MIGVSIFIFIGLGLCGKWGAAQFLNNRPFPRYSLEDMPDTDFSCRDKILGGYYADPQTQCQMFHVCVKVSGVGIQDFRFLCPNSTAFDQEHQICADWEDVDCDAATLYYSSDNFDLYRIGSGFESKVAKYGEEEEPYALQRAETGDIRLNREHQTQRINQQKENRARLHQPQQRQQTNQRNNNYNHNDNDKDIFRVSSSSNFFNNRNGGKETDEYDEDSSNVNANQNDDSFQRKKLAGKQTNKPRYEEPQTQKPSQPTLFVNNFAGSSYTTTTRSISTTLRNENTDRGRQRQRGRYHYNTNNNKQNSGQYQEDDGQYREDNSGQYNRNNQEPQFTVSTPAPFRRPQHQYQTFNSQSNTNNDRNTSPTTEKSLSSFSEQQKQTNRYNQYDTQSTVSQNYPVRDTQTVTKQNQNYSPTPFEKQTKEAENYPSTFLKETKSYPSTSFVSQPKETQTYSPVGSKQPQTNSPTPFQKTVKESETSSTTFRNTQQYTIAPFYKENKSTEGYYSTSLDPLANSPNHFKQQTKETDFYPTPSNNRQTQPNKYESYSTRSPVNDNTQQPQFQSNYEITKTKQSDYSPTQNFKKLTTYAKSGDINPTTFSPKPNHFKTPTFSESYSSTLGYRTTGNQQNNYYDKQNNYNQQDYQNRNPQNGNNGSRSTNAQTPIIPQYNQPQQNNRQTTPHYTPTVPRITASYYSSTPIVPTSRRSTRFDETQYDDGSYNPKYDNENNGDEVLNTAHSTNFASSRNEYAQNTKNSPSVHTQKPRPFSVTPNPPQQIESTKIPLNSQDSSKKPSGPNTSKKSKDYDYAYYDTNVEHNHEYDIGFDIEKSNSSKNRKSA